MGKKLSKIPLMNHQVIISTLMCPAATMQTLFDYWEYWKIKLKKINIEQKLDDIFKLHGSPAKINSPSYLNNEIGCLSLPSKTPIRIVYMPPLWLRFGYIQAPKTTWLRLEKIVVTLKRNQRWLLAGDGNVNSGVKLKHVHSQPPSLPPYRCVQTDGEGNLRGRVWRKWWTGLQILGTRQRTPTSYSYH